jgi:class 3 adenylate cyclase
LDYFQISIEHCMPSPQASRAEERRLSRRIGITRIGVVTGTVTVGSFEGDVLLNYTAQGPAMNLAAWLKAANREFVTTICVDEAPATACWELHFRSLGAVRAKGFSAPVAGLHPLF